MSQATNPAKDSQGRPAPKLFPLWILRFHPICTSPLGGSRLGNSQLFCAAGVAGQSVWPTQPGNNPLHRPAISGNWIQTIHGRNFPSGWPKLALRRIATTQIVFEGMPNDPPSAVFLSLETHEPPPAGPISTAQMKVKNRFCPTLRMIMSFSVTNSFRSSGLRQQMPPEGGSKWDLRSGMDLD